MNSEEEIGVVSSKEDGGPIQGKNPEWMMFFRTHPHLKRVIGVASTSIISTLVILAIVGVVGWTQRDKIVALLVSTLPASQVPISIPVSSPENRTPPKDDLPKELTVTEVVAKVNPSVVSIEVSKQVQVMSINQLIPGFFVQQPSGDTESKVVGKGSGFFVSSDGLVVTNRHVVEESGVAFVVITSGGKRYGATLIAKDPVFDLAVLKVQGANFPAVTLGNSDNLDLGQSVVAIGFALGQFKNSISVGVVSGLSRSIVAGGNGTSEQLDRVIQTDAAINPGNSGGPLINLRGEVVGVNVAVAEGSQSVGFALPSNSVKQVVNSVKAYGTIIRPYLGIAYSQVTTDTQRQNNLTVDYGVLVSAVVPDSPASRAGIQNGDIVLSIDGTKLDGDPSFSTLIRGKKVGQNIMLVILRNGAQIATKATLAQAPD